MQNQIRIDNIIRPRSYKKHFISGRGQASGKGCKSGRGSDGQKVRSGDSKPRTEGGQYPSYLRTRKKGFVSKKDKVNIIKLSKVDKIARLNNKKEILLSDIISHLKLDSKHKIKILFDKKPCFCSFCESNYASKKVFENVKVSLIK